MDISAHPRAVRRSEGQKSRKESMMKKKIGGEGLTGNNAADGPDVDAAAVLAIAQEHLGCAIPPSNDLERHGSLEGRERPRQTEISNLDAAISGDEDVVRLEVSVHDAHEVAILDARKHLSGEGLRVAEITQRKEISSEKEGEEEHNSEEAGIGG